MASVQLRSNLNLSFTMIPNQFIDRYMTQANGEFVKVYLYLLRCLGEQNQELTVGQLADVFNHTENDIIRALKYWESQGLLELVCDGSDQILGIVMEEMGSSGKERKRRRNAPAREEAAAGRADSLQELALKAELTTEQTEPKAPARKPYTVDQLARLNEDEEFSQLLYITQKYMNVTFTPMDCDVMAYLYDGLHFSVELLEYLVDVCVSGGHKSLRYLEAVALDWHKRGLMTVERAKAYSETFNKDCFAVMKAFGLNDRRPGQVEMQMMNKWFGAYGFSRDIVLEACNRTLAKTHNPSFEYADRILSDWNKAGVRYASDIKALDQQYQAKAQSAGKKDKDGKKPKASGSANNRFHNFEQRDYDYDALIRQMNEKQ